MKARGGLCTVTIGNPGSPGIRWNVSGPRTLARSLRRRSDLLNPLEPSGWSTLNRDYHYYISRQTAYPL